MIPVQTGYQKHLKPTPPYQELLVMNWEPSVWATYQRFLKGGEEDAYAIARRYLELQFKLNDNPRNERLVASTSSQVTPEILSEAIGLVLHPYQTPLMLEALQGELLYQGVKVHYVKLQRFCNELSDASTEKGLELRRFQNPYAGRCHVYCSSAFQVYPQLGDKVVEMVRRRSQRFGTVVDFKIYRLNGKRYPIIETAESRYFVDPERIIVVERFEPFAKPTSKTRRRPHAEAFSLLS